ncbi:MAG: hypothetical protein WC869_15410 [Phycisphaerae bacterium]|jgi:hypothetical protein
MAPSNTKLKIFLAGVIQGSLVEAKIHAQDWREPIKALLARYLPAADVYCHYSCHPNSITYGMDGIRRTLEEGLAQAAACPLMVAYVPTASMGTAVEMYEACRNGRVVLTISPLAANWIIRAYSDRIFADVAAFEDFLASGELAQLLKQKAQR